MVGTGMKVGAYPPSLILVREWESQMSSSGCCGRLEGDMMFLSGESCFPDRRRLMEGAGKLYQAVMERFGDRVELQVVDPRNVLAIVPLILRDCIRHRVPLREGIRALAGLSVSAVIVNGRQFSSGEWPDPGGLCQHLERLMGVPEQPVGWTSTVLNIDRLAQSKSPPHT